MATEDSQQQQSNPYAGRFRQAGRNKVSLTGNLTHDPVIKEPKGGPTKVCVLRMAVNGPVPRDKSRKQRVDYFRVDVWGSPNSNARPEAQFNHLKKGRQITVDGRIQIDQKMDSDNRITDTFVTIVADDVYWGGAPAGAASPDAVTVDQGTPDTISAEPATAPATEAPAAEVAVADPPPY